MKLLDAHRLINEASTSDRPVRRYALATGFTPLALETFVRAHLQQRRSAVRVDIEVGRFGDLGGNVERAADSDVEGIAVAVEWSDLDPRLGWRSAATVGESFRADVVGLARDAAARLARRIEAAGARRPVAVTLPTLPLPPLFLSTAGAAGAAALGLRAVAAAFGAELAATPGVRVVDPQALDAASPFDARADLTADLLHGFPYQRAHAAVVGGALAAALTPAAAKKGLISDLDNTLWRGIVGEVGAAGVAWGLEHGAQPYAVYQRCLAALAESGVLVAIASKNDPAVVAEALRREDLLVPSESVFPVHASWGAKSAAVAAILEAWNVGADSVVFVDDSPLEIAEVQARFPEVEGILFDGRDPAGVARVVERLRTLFGKDAVREEDRLRAASLRGAATMRAAADDAADAEAFAAQLGARVTFELSRDVGDARAFELVNKTNQFNLNGRRYTEAEWRAALERPGAFLVTVSYEDRFGPLGKVGVALGEVTDGEVRVDGWVLSCRAFSRRIEDLTLRTLLDAFGAETVVLDVARTPRNGPTQEMVARYGPLPDVAGPVRVTREAFDRAAPTLYHDATLRVADDLPAAAALAAGRPASTPAR